MNKITQPLFSIFFLFVLVMELIFAGCDVKSKSDPVDNTPDSIVAEAKKYIDWTSFDCSSFVQTVYANVGITVPRTVAEQYTHCKNGNVLYSKSSALKGDILFMESDGNYPRHVEIYEDEQSYIEWDKTDPVGQKMWDLYGPQYSYNYVKEKDNKYYVENHNIVIGWSSGFGKICEVLRNYVYKVTRETGRPR